MATNSCAAVSNSVHAQCTWVIWKDNNKTMICVLVQEGICCNRKACDQGRLPVSFYFFFLSFIYFFQQKQHFPGNRYNLYSTSHTYVEISSFYPLRFASTRFNSRAHILTSTIFCDRFFVGKQTNPNEHKYISHQKSFVKLKPIHAAYAVCVYLCH